MQYGGGVYRIADWSHITNAHTGSIHWCWLNALSRMHSTRLQTPTRVPVPNAFNKAIVLLLLPHRQPTLALLPSDGERLMRFATARAAPPPHGSRIPRTSAGATLAPPEVQVVPAGPWAALP
jgi:hypothetical protein